MLSGCTSGGTAAETDLDRIALVREGVRARRLAVERLYGWFVEETYYEEAYQARTGVRNRALHLFYWSTPAGWREDSARFTTAPTLEARTTLSFDGRRYLEYDSSRSERTVCEAPSLVPLVPSYLDLAAPPPLRTYSDNLLEAQVDRLARERIGAHECWRLEAPRRDGGRDVWWVAPELGYAIVKTQHDWPVTEQESAGRGFRVVDRFERHGSTWVPVVMRIGLMEVRADGTRHWGTGKRFTVLELHVNADDSALPFALVPCALSVPVETSRPEFEILGGDPTMYIERIRQPIDESLTSEDPVEVER